MPAFAANLTMLFTEVPFLDRFALAKEAGFRFVEYLFPYDFDPAELRRQLDQHGLRQVLFNLPSGNWGQGDRGIAADPARVAEFRAGVPKAVEYALALGVGNLNCLAGKRVAGVDEALQLGTLAENLQFAARLLGVVTGLLEWFLSFALGWIPGVSWVISFGFTAVQTIIVYLDPNSQHLPFYERSKLFLKREGILLAAGALSGIPIIGEVIPFEAIAAFLLRLLKVPTKTTDVAK